MFGHDARHAARLKSLVAPLPPLLDHPADFLVSPIIPSQMRRLVPQQVQRLWNGITKPSHLSSSPGLVALENVGDTVNGLASSSGNPPSVPTMRSVTTNVVLFGETGVGKSCVINLIAQSNIAKTSSDADGCTMESTPYNISFDGRDFTIFDTVGLDLPEMGTKDYLKAAEMAFELIRKLETAGGVHLLLFCMRGGRMTATTQSNYRMFYECLCSKNVPIALVITGLEREANMEGWWERNEAHILRYGIQSQGHACVTGVNNGSPEECDRYTKSQEKIRNIIKQCALDSVPPFPESYSWFAKVAKKMASFIRKRSEPGRNQLMKTLTQRCHLARDVAERIIEMMEQNDPEPSRDKT